MHARSTPQSNQTLNGFPYYYKHSTDFHTTTTNQTLNGFPSLRRYRPPLFGNPNRVGECIPRYSRRGSCAEFSEVCILGHRLLTSAHAMRLPSPNRSPNRSPKTAALSPSHSTSRRHAASRTPRPPCCAYPNWKGSSGPWKKALSSAFSPGYHLTSRFSKSAK